MRTPLKNLARHRASGRLALVACAGLLLASTIFSHAQAIMAQGAIDLKGRNGIATDSFDSSAPDYPGYWTNSIRKAGGDVVTASTITNFSVGNANIAGHVRTGLGGGYTIMANGSVGDLAWVDSSTPGVEPGWFSDDMNFIIHDVVIPQVIWTDAPGAGTAFVNGTLQTFATTRSVIAGTFTLRLTAL